eukprot:2544432-Pyramimonas_sp.AAC.1
MLENELTDQATVPSALAAADALQEVMAIIHFFADRVIADRVAAAPSLPRHWCMTALRRLRAHQGRIIC